jgi:diguanylate cyclase (GGDEF)-like protein
MRQRAASSAPGGPKPCDSSPQDPSNPVNFRDWIKTGHCMTSPVFFILVALAGINAMLSLLFFIAWHTLGRKPYALSWAVAFLAATAQWSGNIFAASFPSWEVHWLTVNACALTFITLGVRGHCQRTGYRGLPGNLWPYSIVVFAAIAWTTVIQPHVGLRTMLVPAYGMFALLLIARMIIGHRVETRPAEYATAAMMTVFGLLQGIVAAMALMQGADGDAAFRSLYVQFNFLTLPAGYVGMAMFVLFMMTSDLAAEMKAIAVRDQLTGVLNRRGFSEQCDKIFSLAARRKLPVALILADIDKFKRINDEYGHEAGDEALRHFTRLLQVSRRREDVLARIGGEEFALILPGTTLDSAETVADMLRERAEIAPLTYKGKPIPMTASFGIASLQPVDRSMADVIVRADSALYRSKREGRNRVELESPALLESGEGDLQPV